MAEERHADYKHVDKTPEHNRGKRRDHTVELRKFKRDEQHIKRRNINVEDQLAADTVEFENVHSLLMRIKQERNPFVLKAAITDCRRLLSQPVKPPIQQVIEFGLVPMMVNLLQTSADPEMQLEAAWVLTNICSGTTEQTNAVVGAGAVPQLVQLLDSPHDQPRDQAIWALANIAGDGPAHRDQVLAAGALEVFLRLVMQIESLSVKRTLVWAISNLCRYHNPAPPLEKVYLALPVIKSILATSQDVEMKRDACWSISYLTSEQSERIRAVVETGFIPLLVELLHNTNVKLLTPAIRALGNIVSCSADEYTDVILQFNVMNTFRRLLTTMQDDMVRREICWMTSNVLCGAAHQRRAVIESTIVVSILYLFNNPGLASKVKNEIGFVVGNLLTRPNATLDEKTYTMHLDVLPIILNLLDEIDAVVDQRLRMLLLHSLQVIFDLSVQLQMPYIDMFESLNGHRTLEKQMQLPYLEVQQLADELLRTFVHNEQVDVLGAPAIAQHQPGLAMYNFAPQMPHSEFNFS